MGFVVLIVRMRMLGELRGFKSEGVVAVPVGDPLWPIGTFQPGVFWREALSVCVPHQDRGCCDRWQRPLGVSWQKEVEKMLSPRYPEILIF